MNTAAYLTKQGWRGQGHSLDNTNRGLAKPLLVAHKYDSIGLGKKKADHDFSNQWWLDAWSPQNSAAQAQPVYNSTGLGLLQQAGLYSHFVKGQVLESTFDMAKREAAAALRSSSTNGHEKSSSGDGSKKRKHRTEVDDTDTSNNGHGGDVAKKTSRKEKKAKTSNELATQQDSQAASAAAIPAPMASEVAEKKSKKLPREIRAERKIKKAETARINANRNRIEEAEIRKELAEKQGLDVEDDNWQTSDDENSDVDEEPQGPAHQESIAGLRAAGQHVLLPLLPENLPKDSKHIIYRTYEAARKQAVSEGRCKLVLPFLIEYVAQYGQPVFDSSKLSSKADKIERESLKRQAKREYRHWRDEVFVKHWLYRPDGMPVDGSDVNIEHGTKTRKKEKKPKKPKEKVDHAKLNEEKKARRAARAERREKMRTIKKEARAERKRRNEIKQVELRRAAEERRKDAQRQLDIAEAAKQGMDYEDFVQKKLNDVMDKKISNSQKKKAKAQAKADISKTRQELMLASGDFNGLSVTTPILAANGSEKESKKKGKSGSARKGSDFISLDAGASDDDSDDTSTVDVDDGEDDENVGSARDPAHLATSGAAAGGEPSEALGFVVDTVGTQMSGAAAAAGASAPGARIPPKKVKDMTKEERKARLELMRARRAERRARQGKDPKSKKDKSMSRAERKERMINKLTSEILLKKRQLAPDVDAPEVQAMSKKEAKALPPEARGWTRDDWKSARREARRFQRAVKAGKVPEHEVPLGWTGTVRSAPKRKGNGGRDPARPFWHEWSNGGARLDLRDHAGGA